MTFEAQLVPVNRRYRVRTPEEDERAFRAAARHSRLVRMLRKGLPILAVVVFASYFISTRLSITVGGVTASVAGIEVKDGNLRMVKPSLKGVDKKKGNYVINADYADQNMKNPKVIALHAISAEVASGDQGWSRVNAIRGVFNSESGRLALLDDIRVSTSSGLTGKLTYATIETNNQLIRSHSPVVFNMPNAILHAHALTLHSSQSEIVFRGKVRLHIDRSDNKNPAQAAPAGGTAPPEVKAPQGPTREPATASVAADTPAAPMAIVPRVVAPSAPRPAPPSQPVEIPALPQ